MTRKKQLSTARCRCMSREELESSLRASLVATSVGEMLGKIVKIVERRGKNEAKTPFRKLLKISLIPSWA